MDTGNKIKQLTTEVIRKLAQQGNVVEGGWNALVRLNSLDTVGTIQYEEMRKAYYAGAQHLFASIMNLLQEGSEPTDADMQLLSSIAAELESWAAEMRKEWGSKLEGRGEH